jgi:hypothetical protein
MKLRTLLFRAEQPVDDAAEHVEVAVQAIETK